MTEQEMFIQVYAAIMRGYTARQSSLLSDTSVPDSIRDFANKTAAHAVESSREFTPPERKISDLPSTIPTYVHTFVHAHSNWVAVDPVDGTKREYIDEPFLTGDEKRYFGEGQSEILGRAGSTLLGLKQKRQR